MALSGTDVIWNHSCAVESDMWARRRSRFKLHTTIDDEVGPLVIHLDSKPWDFIMEAGRCLRKST